MTNSPVSKPKLRRVGKNPFDFDEGDPLFAHTLSLEFEKKRAKKLLKARKESGDTNTKLSDIQFELARQHGFASWPRFKAHIEQAKIEMQAVETGTPTALDGDKPTLHIRCGTDIKQALEVGGFQGDFVGFFDPFVMGPVSSTQTLEDHLEIRAKFLDNAGWVNSKNALKNHQNHYRELEKSRNYSRVALWFEHDSFDVLILAYLLNYFSDPAKRPGQLQFICITGYPGVQQFNGLGQLPPQALRVLWSWFEQVSEPQLALGCKVWNAICSPSPVPLMEIIATGTPDIPPFAKALKRHLQELPCLGNGLSLVEKITLEILKQQGPIKAGLLFGQYSKSEPLRYLGDTMFKTYVENLANAEHPALTITSVDASDAPFDASNWFRSHTVSLTQIGHDLLADQKNWLEMGVKDRWVGGIKIKPAEPGWRWDFKNDRPVYSDSEPTSPSSSVGTR